MSKWGTTSLSLLQRVVLQLYCLKVKRCFDWGWECVCVLNSKPCSSFPWRAASSVHVRLNVVQHVSQCVFNHSSPAHVTHLREGKKNNHRSNDNSVNVSVKFVLWTKEQKLSPAGTLGPSEGVWNVAQNWQTPEKRENKVLQTRKQKKKESRKTTRVTNRAALVEGDGREVEAFKQVVKSNTLAHTVFKEYHLKNRIRELTAANTVRFSDWILFWRGYLTLLGLIGLRLFSALST